MHDSPEMSAIRQGHCAVTMTLLSTLQLAIGITSFESSTQGYPLLQQAHMAGSVAERPIHCYKQVLYPWI